MKLFGVLVRRRPDFVLRIENLKIFLHLRSKSFKIINFVIRQDKFKNNTDVYSKNLTQCYAKFIFSNHMGFDSRVLKHTRVEHRMP